MTTKGGFDMPTPDKLTKKRNDPARDAAIDAALKAANGNVRDAAIALGVYDNAIRHNLKRRMKTPADYRQSEVERV
jgi:transcriptional regulator of acetoin/glycerol metabolism